MPINPVPERSDALEAEGPLGGQRFMQAWLEFFRSIFFALFGWKRSFTATKALVFPNIAAGGEASLTVTVAGARPGDAVVVTPTAKTAGIIDNYGLVTVNDTVTVYAHNITAGAIGPASKNYRVIVYQQ